MEFNNPIEQLRHRFNNQNVSTQQQEHEHKEQTILACLNLYHTTLDVFLNHLNRNNFPYARITKLNNKEYVSIPLFNVSHNSDREGYYDNDPLTLLIDEHGGLSYTYEALPSGQPSEEYSESRWSLYPPVPFIIPTTPYEYERIGQSISPKQQWKGYNLIGWSAHMLQQMERFQEFGHEDSPRVYLATHYRKPQIYQELIRSVDQSI